MYIPYVLCMHVYILHDEEDESESVRDSLCACTYLMYCVCACIHLVCCLFAHACLDGISFLFVCMYLCIYVQNEWFSVKCNNFALFWKKIMSCCLVCLAGLYIYIYIYICVRMQAHVWTLYIQHIYMYTYIHTYIHTYMYMCVCDKFLKFACCGTQAIGMLACVYIYTSITSHPMWRSLKFVFFPW